jgi:hypothetical protein
MATQAAVERWDEVLGDIEQIYRRMFEKPLEAVIPTQLNFAEHFRFAVDTLTKDFDDAWRSDPPIAGSRLHTALYRVVRAIEDLDYTQPAAAQVASVISVIAEVRSEIAQSRGQTKPEEVLADLEHLVKVSVLAARVSHRGAVQIADDERRERDDAINNAIDRPPQFLDLATMEVVQRPSKTTLSMALLLSKVDPAAIVGCREVITLREMLLNSPAGEKPEILKQFAAQWVVHVHTEWEEHYRRELASVLGCDPADIRSAYFSDLNRMRQDYVHHRGICRNSAGNKLLKWFCKGENMIPDDANYRQLLTAFPSEGLRIKPSPVALQRQPLKANADPELARQFLAAAGDLQMTKDAALDQALTEWIAAHTQA